MPFIYGIDVEKQSGAELCWAAATKSVLDYYHPGACPSQEAIQKAYGKEGQEAASPELALRATKSLRSAEDFLGDESALTAASRIFVKIKDSIQASRPVIVYIQETGGGGFRHALVIYGVEDYEKTVHFLDPARPNVRLEAPIEELMMGWALYADIPQAQGLAAFARRFFFTEKPTFLSSHHFGVD